MRFFSQVDWGTDGKAPPKYSKEMLLRIGRFFLPYWKYGLCVIGCILLGAMLNAVQPLFIKGILDNAIPDKDYSKLNILIAGMIFTPVLAGLISVGQNYFSTLIGQRVMFDMGNQLYSHLMHMSLRFYTSTKTGEIMSHVNNDVSGLEKVVTETLGSFFQNLINFITTMIVMFMIDWRLTLLSLVILPVFILPTKRIARMNYLAKKEVQEKVAELNSITQESLNISGATLIKAFGTQEREKEKYFRKNWELMQLNIKQKMIGRWFFMILRVISDAGPAIVYWYGGYLVIREQMTLGTVIAFTAYLSRLYKPVSALGNIHVNIKGSVALFERLFSYLDLPVEIISNPNGISLKGIKKGIKFDNVNFSYLPDQPILKNVSFEIRAGQTIGLVGPSGSGKSTVSYLLRRFYDPIDGSITIDDIDLKDIKIESLSESIGMVLQETELFHGSIQENLLYAVPEASETEMLDAAKKAYIHDFIVSLAQGYQTVIGERGYKLSGGEKQRLAIARVILKNPDLIIFDEATSSLDSHSENLIQQALQPLLVNRTSLVIAHRLSTVVNADKILVLDKGEIVEVGTHKELLNKNGLYASLYREQFGENSTM